MAEGNFASLLGSVFGSSSQDDELKKKIEQARQLMEDVSGGNAPQFQAQVDMLRGARAGAPDERLTVLTTPEDQAIADRYAWGAEIKSQNPLVGPLSLAPPIAYEGVKAIAPGILGAIGKLLPQGEEMKVNEKTSPASMANIRALLAGYYGS